MIRFLLGLITGATAGAALGAAAGLLLAPKTGEETRQIVAARAPEVLQKARDCVDSILQRIREEATQGAEEESDNHVEAPGS